MMKQNTLDMFRLEDRVLFEAAAVAEIVEAADAARENPNANVNEAEKQAQEERDTLKNAPPENPADRTGNEENSAPGEPSGLDAELDQLINGEITPADGIDVDAAGDAADGDSASEFADNGAPEMITVDFLDQGNTVSTDRELVVVNSSVADADDIVAALKPNQEALILDSSHDAMEQIHDYLDQHGEARYSALHIVSHGNEGYFVLNGKTFNAENFNAADWNEIGDHLTDNGDILLL